MNLSIPEKQSDNDPANCEIAIMGKMIYIPGSAAEKTGYESIRKEIGFYLHTPGGRSQLNHLHPVRERSGVEELTRQTSEMLTLLEENETVPIFTIEDIGDWLHQAKAEGTVLSLKSFTLIRSHARIARILKNFFERHKESRPALWKIAGQLQPANELEQEIDRTVSDQGSLKDDASPELKNIRSRLNGKRHNLRSVIQKLFKKATREGRASDEGPTIRNGRMVIPVLAEYKRKIDGFVHDVSSSGQTVYMEPVEALQINNDIRHLEAEELREIERILKYLTSLVRKFQSRLQINITLLGSIDLIHARTRLGLTWNGVLPRCSNDQSWNISKGRNPLLLLKNRQLKEEDRDEVVPLDLELRKPQKGILISGPNAGGKSVALKTVGILAMMHQSGIPLPLEPHSELTVISGIYLDMGDDQSIENDLSTFSSRLKWMHDTLETISSNSLVLIDEAGTGTDPDEGGALFQAFLEKVLDLNVCLIATTHHGALKVFANDHPQLSNGAMEFDQDTLSPTYRFRKGIPGSSYAFEIADRMKLPEDLIARSRSLLGAQRDRMAELLLDLEQRLQQAEETRRKYHVLRKKAESEEQQFKTLRKKLDHEREEKLNEAYLEADRIMKDANRRIEQAVEQIVTLGKDKRENMRAVRKEVADYKQKIKRKIEDSNQRETDSTAAAPQKEPSIGDPVKISGGDTTGELIEKQGNQAIVLAGGLKIKTKYSNLEKTELSREKDKISRWKSASHSQTYSRSTISPALNIRGKRGDEAVNEVMHYLDNAIAGGLQEVQIIHGKGEGILKKLVHEYLENREEVKEYHIAPLELGGAGCTVVRLH